MGLEIMAEARTLRRRCVVACSGTRRTEKTLPCTVHALGGKAAPTGLSHHGGARGQWDKCAARASVLLQGPRGILRLWGRCSGTHPELTWGQPWQGAQGARVGLLPSKHGLDPYLPEEAPVGEASKFFRAGPSSWEKVHSALEAPGSSTCWSGAPAVAWITNACVLSLAPPQAPWVRAPPCSMWCRGAHPMGFLGARGVSMHAPSLPQPMVPQGLQWVVISVFWAGQC